MISGDYYFHDDLKYETSDWKYCDGNDRRFYPEHLRGIKPAGGTQMTKEEKRPYDLPEGTYGDINFFLEKNLLILINF